MTAALAGVDADVMGAAAIVDRGWPIGPCPMPCRDCGLELGRHAGHGTPFPGGVPGVCQMYYMDPAFALAIEAWEAADRQWMDVLVDAADAGYRPSGRRGPRVSDFDGCPRQVWYRENPPADYTAPAPVESRRAALGGVIHRAAQDALARAFPWRRYEYEVPIPGLDKPGRIDEYDPVLGEVTDGKTCGEYKWQVYGDGGVPRAAVGQVLIYAYALEALGLPVKTCRVVAINRDSGAEEHFRWPYDPAEALAALDELLTLATQLELGVTPPRAGTGPGRFPCSYCEARLHCWNVEGAVAAGRSPESYTLLGAEPDDPTIAWAAEQAYLATKASTAADTTKDQARALIDGIRPGFYGDWEIYPRPHTSVRWKETRDRDLGLYPLPDGVRPPVERIEEPLRHTSRRNAVKPVRVAQRKPKGKKADERPVSG